MAIKKSELYSSLWQSCDQLRGGMDASQYKDYVLFMLFIKYISDKFGDSKDYAPAVVIPPGAGFKDMVALKGSSDIGDRINTQVIQPLIGAKGARILPHGVLFRGNAEAVIRTQLVRSGILKGIIGLPANLFSSIGIPACILVLDKDNASACRGIFMIDAQQADLDRVNATLTERVEERSGEDGALNQVSNKRDAHNARTEAIVAVWNQQHPDACAAYLALITDIDRNPHLLERQARLKADIKDAEQALDQLACDKYPALDADEVKTLVIDDKWLTRLETAIHGETDRISQTLTSRVSELAERNQTPLPQITGRVAVLQARVTPHLQCMGFLP